MRLSGGGVAQRIAARPRDRVEAWGDLGGHGPLASAESIRTIYPAHDPERDQDPPRVFLYSDPTFPDRTEYLLRGDAAALASRLEQGLEILIAAGATRTLVCCMTLHAALPLVAGRLRARVRSLVDIVIA